MNRNAETLKILVHGINYFPEPTGAGKYTGDMVLWLAERGHDIRVVAAPPYYPQWKVRPDYVAWRYQRKEQVTDGRKITTWRCPLWVPRSPSGPKRICHLTSFALTSAPLVLTQACWRPAVVVCVAPTLLSAPAALTAARVAGAKSWLHIQDFEIDAAFNLGILHSPIVRRALLRVERAVLACFDRVSSISAHMVDRLEQKGVNESRRRLLPNWADLSAIRPLARPSPFRAELQLTDEAIVALYAGNIGEKQGLDIMLEAVQSTQDDRRLVWVIAGTGGALARLKEQSSDYRNLIWLPLQPAERLNDLLNLADMHVIPQRVGVTDFAVPSKFTNIAASGRPCIVAANVQTTLAKIVKKYGTGIVVPPADASALARAARRLAGDPSYRRECGDRARQFAEGHLSRDMILAAFERDLKLVCGNNTE